MSSYGQRQVSPLKDTFQLIQPQTLQSQGNTSGFVAPQQQYGYRPQQAPVYQQSVISQPIKFS